MAQINKGFSFIDPGGHWYNCSKTLQGQNNFCTAMGVEAWGFLPWSLLDQAPNYFLSNHFYPQYVVNKQTNTHAGH